jgi:hypothetical protein
MSTLTALFIYILSACIIFLIGYWFLCKSYKNCPYKYNMTFSEYFEDHSGYVIIPAILWPALILFSPLIILIYICYILSKQIKKYHNIED